MDNTEAFELSCAIEAILFASGDPVSESRLAEVLEIDRAAVRQLAEGLSDHYDYHRRGIKLVRLDDRYQLCSRKDYSPYVRKALETRRTQSLSPSSLEVLAIIAYNQPVTKAQIEQIRGVDSSYTVGSLVDKGLVMDCGKLDVPGRPRLFKTTPDFLRVFGISSLSQLPSLAGDINDDQLSLYTLPPEIVEEDNPDSPEADHIADDINSAESIEAGND